MRVHERGRPETIDGHHHGELASARQEQDVTPMQCNATQIDIIDGRLIGGGTYFQVSSHWSREKPDARGDRSGLNHRARIRPFGPRPVPSSKEETSDDYRLCPASTPMKQA